MAHHTIRRDPPAANGESGAIRLAPLAQKPSVRPLTDASQIVVAGAGCIGCYVGGLLAHAGRRVIFLGRPHTVAALESRGLLLSAFTDIDYEIEPSRLTVTSDPAALAEADLVLVTVKSPGTAVLAADIAHHARPGTTLLTMQSGIGNAQLLRSLVADMDVVSAVVEFGVRPRGPGHFRRGTTGKISIEARRQDVIGLLSAPGLQIAPVEAIQPVQWGRVVIGLNVSLNALSGLPLRDQLRDREWRRLYADMVDEALAVLSAAGIRPAPAPVSCDYLCELLRMPDALFRSIAPKVLKIDPEARSSMRADLDAGKRTEVDYIQGALISLAVKYGVATPLCEATRALIKEAEAARRGPPQLTVEEIRKAARSGG